MNEKAFEALEAFVQTIEATGGVTKDEEGLMVPRADREWVDLGYAYLLACKALGKKPLIDEEDDHE